MVKAYSRQDKLGKAKVYSGQDKLGRAKQYSRQGECPCQPPPPASSIGPTSVVIQAYGDLWGGMLSRRAAAGGHVAGPKRMPTPGYAG